MALTPEVLALAWANVRPWLDPSADAINYLGLLLSSTRDQQAA